MTLEGAVADTLAAVDELCALAEVRRVTVVGLRLGAAIAHRAASTSRAVDRLVMWDPVADGAAYLRELGAPAGAAHNAAAVGGFPMSARLRAEIDALRPDAFDPVPARVLVVSSDGAEKHGRLAARVGTADRPASVESRPGPTAWADQAALGVGAIPTEALAHIVEWMDGTA